VNVVQRSRQRLTNLANREQRPAGWFRMSADGAGPTRVDIYDEIGGGGWFNDGVTAIDFIQQLAGINGDIEVHINSPGGDVFDGLAIYNSLAQRSGNVTTVVDGLAASAASFIAMAGKQRVIAPGAMMMIHDAAGMCMGNASDMRELAELLDKVSDNIAGIYAADDSTASATDWRAAMKAETWYTADEAVAAGLAHRVAERPNAAALAATAKFDLSAYLHAPRITAAEAGATPYEPAPYKREPDETVQCPSCEKLNDDDARFCDQCGTKLVGRDDVSEAEAEAAVSNRTAAGPIVAAGPARPTAKALPIHHTATVDTPWDGPAAEAAMPNDDTVLEYCHAWQSAEAAATPHKEGDDDADDKKANYKFPHHATKGGPANLAACRNGLARLPGADIPDGDRAGVKAHLQAHLDDANSTGGDGAHDHAGLPGWLRNEVTLPAWLGFAEEAK